MSSPTQRTLQECRDRGWAVDVVERWISRPMAKGGVRKDYLGFIDIIAVDPETGDTIGIQATSGSNSSSRVAKIRDERLEEARAWLAGHGNRIQVWSWRKYKQPVDRKWWRVRVVEVTMEDLT